MVQFPHGGREQLWAGQVPLEEVISVLLGFCLTVLVVEFIVLGVPRAFERYF